MVTQDYRLLQHLTVEENIALPLKVAGEPSSVIRERVDEMLEWVGLNGCNDARPEELSGGPSTLPRRFENRGYVPRWGGSNAPATKKWAWRVEILGALAYRVPEVAQLQGRWCPGRD